MFNKRFSFFLGTIFVALVMAGAATADPGAQQEIAAEMAVETSHINIDDSAYASGETIEAGMEEGAFSKNEGAVDVPGDGLCDGNGNDLVQRNELAKVDLRGGPAMMCQQGAVCYSISDCWPGRCVVDLYAGTHTCACP